MIKSVSEYMSEHLYMFYSDTRLIELEIKKDKGHANMTYLVDAFGTNWRYVCEDGDKVIVKVRCTVGAMKIWVMQYSDKVRVGGPADVKKIIDIVIQKQ